MDTPSITKEEALNPFDNTLSINGGKIKVIPSGVFLITQGQSLSA